MIRFAQGFARLLDPTLSSKGWGMRRRSFNGWKMFGQFSFQTGSNPTPGVEQSKWKHNTRRGALTLRFKNEQFTAIAVV